MLLIVLAASILACPRSASDGGDASAGDDREVDGEADAGTDAGSNLTPLVELRQRCIQAGGQFVAGECICPTEQVGGIPVRETFDARFATCALPDSPGDSECLARGSFTQVLDNEGLGALRDCLQYFVVYPFRALRFEIPEEWSSEDARPLAKWLDVGKTGEVIDRLRTAQPTLWL